MPRQGARISFILALVFRGVFILIGAQLIENFSWIFYLFGAFLIYTAITQAFGSEHGDQTDTALIRFAKRHLSLTGLVPQRLPSST